MRSSKNSFVVGYVIAITAGIAVVIFVSTGSFEAFSNWLYRWQTLATGVIALVGAWLLWKQIKDQREERRQELKRLQTKARLQMPHALDDVQTYLGSSFDAWREKKPEERKALPSDALQILIESGASADGDTFDVLQKILSKSQVFEARYRSLDGAEFYDRYMCDFLEYQYLVKRLWGFARFRSDSASYGTPTRRDYLEGITALYSDYGSGNDAEIETRIEQALKYGDRWRWNIRRNSS